MSDITNERVFQMASRAGQLAEKMLHGTDYSLADQPSVSVGSLGGQRTEPLRQFESDSQDNSWLLGQIVRHYEDGDAIDVGTIETMPSKIEALMIE